MLLIALALQSASMAATVTAAEVTRSRMVRTTLRRSARPQPVLSPLITENRNLRTARDLATAETNPYVLKVRDYVGGHLACDAVVISAQIESEIALLDEGERAEAGGLQAVVDGGLVRADGGQDAVVAALAVGARITRDADWTELRWMIPFSIVGAVVGVTLLVNLPQRAIMTALGAFLLIYAVYSLRQDGAPGRVSRVWAPFTGFIGGSMGTLLGIAAPPYAIYLARRLVDTGAYRATLSNMVIFSTTTRALVFLAGGLMLADRLTAFALLLPFALAGLGIGTRISKRVSRAQLLRVISVLLMLIGASLLARATGW